jgi:hypothetical protein
MLLTGDANATDPACSKAPMHGLIEQVLQAANEEQRVTAPATASSLQPLPRDFWVYRINPA